MAFLDDFPSWEAFGDTLKKWNPAQPDLTLPTDVTQAALYAPLDSNTLNVLLNVLQKAGVLPGFIESFRLKYKDDPAELNDFRYGLATLIGVGKGRNSILRQIGDVWCKFGEDQRELMQNEAALAAIRRSAAIARESLWKIERGFIGLAPGRIAGPRARTMDLFRTALDYHFSTPDSRQQLTIQQHYRTIKANLQGSFRLAALSKVQSGQVSGERQTLGVVPVKSRELFTPPPASPHKTSRIEVINKGGAQTNSRMLDYGSIHVDYALFDPSKPDTSPLLAAFTIIHEASHKWCQTRDNSYIDDATYAGQAALLKIANADSYGAFAASVHAGKVIKRNEDCLGHC